MSKHLCFCIAGGYLFLGGVAGVATGRWQTVVGVLVGSAVMYVLLRILLPGDDADDH